MNKWMIGGLVGGLLAFFTMGMVGCTLTDEQVQAIAQGSGLASAITWIAYDNPDTNAINSVKSVITIIEEKAVNVATGVTYTAAIYPEVEKFVNTSGKVTPQYKPIALAGSLALLQGVDLLFVMHPDWKAKEGLSLKIVSSYCMGAKQGLSMSEKDPAMIQARSYSTKRAKVLVK